MKTLDLTFVNMCNQKREIIFRNTKAENYSAKKRKRKLTTDNILLIIMLFCIIAIIVGIFIKVNNTEPRYAIKRENGAYNYTYVTERICKVEEIVQDYVTVSYNGNKYCFFGYGYEIGEEIICQFTDGWEIIGIVE